MRATSTGRWWNWPSATQLRLRLQVKTRERRKYATNRRWKSALGVKSVRIEHYVELGAASRLFLFGTTSLWKVESQLPTPLRLVRKEGGSGSSARSRTTNATISSALTHWNDRRLRSTTENTSDRVTVSNSAPLPPPLCRSPAHTLTKLWLTCNARNERARWKIWGKIQVLVGWDVWNEAGQ